MIKISICFIVGEARPAGTRSHSATGRERQKDRQPKKKERGEREIRAIKRREREKEQYQEKKRGEQ